MIAIRVRRYTGLRTGAFHWSVEVQQGSAVAEWRNIETYETEAEAMSHFELLQTVPLEPVTVVEKWQ